MTKISHIYKITHVGSGRVYVGQTSRSHRLGPIIRWVGHLESAKRGSKTHFHCAIRLYGREAFLFEILEKCTSDTVNDRERYYIAALKSNEKLYGFNMSEGGDGGQNSMSLEVRQKISASKAGIPAGPCSPEKAENIRAAKLASGYRHSDQTIQNIKEGRKHVVSLTSEWRENISAGLIKSAKYKLTLQQELEIKNRLQETDQELAKQFSVSRKTIWRIRRNLYREKQT